MINKTNVTKESFDTLLSWLDTSREGAAQKYEKIRGRLIKIFAGRGCFEAEDLADETINRVILKLPHVIENYAGDPTLYFYGVANNIHLEWLRKQRNIKRIQIMETNSSEVNSELEYDCLENCLRELAKADRQLIVDYYREEKSGRIENRRHLAEKLGISVNALQVKTSRIRTNLRKCLLNCLAENLV